jgi:serine/threonine protein kinase
LRVKGEVKAYNFPGYDTVERLTRREDLVELVMRPKAGRLRNLQRFRIFTCPAQAAKNEKERFLRRARNTFDAIGKAGDHRNLLRVWEIPNEYGQIVEASESSDQGSLADLIDRSEGGLPLNEALAFVRGILHGLIAVHSQAVIHRMVKPENILLSGHTPKLMNFDLAYHLEEDHLTVITDGTRLKSDAYTAPEVYQRGEPSEATDLFSVGVILFELITGAPPFKASTDLASMDGQMSRTSRDLLAAKAPANIVQLADFLVRTDPKQRLQRAEDALELLDAGSRPTEPLPDANRILPAGEIYDVYEIDRLVGQGAQSQIYAAFRGHARERIALKLFDVDIPQEKVWAERAAAQSVNSPYVIRIDNLGLWQRERYYLAMNLVEGSSMRQEIEQGNKPSLERFLDVAQALLQAMCEMHERVIDTKRVPLLHNDIKPDNVLFRSENHPVIIDFGVASEPGISTYVGTEGYVAPDLRHGADREFSEGGDVFALAVTLFEWLCGSRPYDSLVSNAECCDVAQLRPDVPTRLASWLRRAVGAASAQRFWNCYPDA